MTKHADIISRIGPLKLSESIGEPTNNIYQWRRNDSIPSPYWKAIVSAGLATADELLNAAAQKRQPS